MAKNFPKRITMWDLYPDLSPDEQEEAEANLKAYVGLVWRIYNRLKLKENWVSLENHFCDTRGRSEANPSSI